MPKKKSTEGVYEVECITAARVTDDHQWEYNIKWGGYSEDENSWEPEANLNGCARMMTQFWQQVGPINKGLSKKFPVNHELTPSELWMDLQRDTYQRTQAKKKAQKNKLRHAKPKETSRAKVPPRPRAPFWASGATDQSAREPPTSDSDDDDTPLSEKIKVTARALAPRSNTDDQPALSSKRKRDDASSSEPSNKRLKSTVAGESSMTSSQEGFATSSHVDDTQEAVAIPSRDDGPQEGVAASSKDDAAQGAIVSSTDKIGVPPASPHNSLFGDGSDSEDIPLAFKASMPPPAVSQITKEQTRTATQPSMSPETQNKEKSKIPLHRQRKQNPRVKQMDIPLLNTNLGGISTKTRILSQNSAKSAGPGLPKTSMWKNASGPSLGIGAIPTLMDSPDLTTPDLDAINWLKENISTKEELARAGPNTSRPSSAEPSSSIAGQQVQRFIKRWRWTGQLAVGDNETGFAEPVGSIVITDNTLPNRQPTFEALLPTGVDTICLRHQYTLSALQTVLGDFTLSQFAVMTADKSDDETSFDDVVSYMSKYEMFSQCALAISDREAATLFVFPSTCLPLLDNLGVPMKVRQDNGLIVAAGFKAYIPPERPAGGFVETYTEDWKAGSKVDLGQETRSADCSRARLVLSFPENLSLRLNNKPCTIFTTPGDQALPGHETRSLITILKSAPGCKIVPLLTGNARFVFIHVSSWGMLHKLPGLVDRRLRRPDIQFYTYGSDPSIERKRWGVHEVFPLGGVVTFTPRAIMENPAGVEQLIAKLDEHPLWTCYILPSVIPKLCEIAAEQSSGEFSAKSGIEALCSILFPIEKGQIALTWQPPQRVELDANSGAKWIDWMMDQGRLSDLHGGDLVLECQKRFERLQDRSEKDVEERIVRDLLEMQSELREEYRRFVIITDSTGPSNASKEAASSTSSSKADIKDGFELTHVTDFVFNDDYVFSDRIKSS